MSLRDNVVTCLCIMLIYDTQLSFNLVSVSGQSHAQQRVSAYSVADWTKETESQIEHTNKR